MAWINLTAARKSFIRKSLRMLLASSESVQPGRSARVLRAAAAVRGRTSFPSQGRHFLARRASALDTVLDVRPHELGLSQDVALHGFQEVGLGCPGRQVQFEVEGVQTEDIAVGPLGRAR